MFGDGHGTQASLVQSPTGPSDYPEAGAHMGWTCASTPSHGPRLSLRGKRGREREGKGLLSAADWTASVLLIEGVSVEAIPSLQKLGAEMWEGTVASSFIFPAPQPYFTTWALRNAHSHERTRIPSTFRLSTSAHASGPGYLFANCTPTLHQIFPRTVLTTPQADHPADPGVPPFPSTND